MFVLTHRRTSTHGKMCSELLSVGTSFGPDVAPGGLYFCFLVTGHRQQYRRINTTVVTDNPGKGSQ